MRKLKLGARYRVEGRVVRLCAMGYEGTAWITLHFVAPGAHQTRCYASPKGLLQDMLEWEYIGG